MKLPITKSFILVYKSHFLQPWSDTLIFQRCVLDFMQCPCAVLAYLIANIQEIFSIKDHKVYPLIILIGNPQLHFSFLPLIKYPWQHF